MTRGPHGSTTEMLLGLRTSGKSNLKTHLPLKFVDFCHVSPLMDGPDLLWDFRTSTLRLLGTSTLRRFDTSTLRCFETFTLRRFRTTTLRLFRTSTLRASDLRKLYALLTSNLLKPISMNPRIGFHLSPFKIYNSCSLQPPGLRTFALALYLVQF
jgi:hypothetical protein